MSFYTNLLRRAEMVKNWRKWVERIAREAKVLIPGAEIYVIGSVARGDYVASSDVDVVVVSPSVPRSASSRGRVKALIEERAKLPYYHPFEIHILRPVEAQYYFRKASSYIVKIEVD